MTLPIAIALASLALTFLGSLSALLAAWWKFSAVTTELTTSVNALRERTKNLDEIPLLVGRVGQIENMVAKHNSMIPTMTARLAILEDRQTRPSRHEI